MNLKQMTREMPTLMKLVGVDGERVSVGDEIFRTVGLSKQGLIEGMAAGLVLDSDYDRFMEYINSDDISAQGLAETNAKCLTLMIDGSIYYNKEIVGNLGVDSFHITSNPSELN